METTADVNCVCGHNLMRHNQFISEGVFGCVDCDCKKMETKNCNHQFVPDVETTRLKNEGTWTCINCGEHKNTEPDNSRFKYTQFALWKKSEVTGCTFEDGGDNREYSSELILVPSSEEESFGEHMASCYGDQDYSYQVSFKQIGSFSGEELTQLKDLIEKESKKPSHSCLHAHTKYVRQNERVTVDECLDCGGLLEYPRELEYPEDKEAD